MQNQFKIGEFVTFIHSSKSFLITGFTENGLAYCTTYSTEHGYQTIIVDVSLLEKKEAGKQLFTS